MRNYYFKMMIEKIFEEGFRKEKWSNKGCELGEDEMGKYFVFDGYSPKYWYSDWNAILGRWTSEIAAISGVKFRYVEAGLGKGANYRHFVMKKDNKFYIIKGIDIRQENDIAGPRGVECFKFGQGENISLVKTERSLKTMLGKLDITEIKND